ALVANQGKPPIERWRRQTGDLPAGSGLEVDFRAYKIFRWRRKNLRGRARGNLHRLAGKRHKHVAEMDSKSGPGAGRSLPRIAAPVCGIHFPEIIMAAVGIHVQQTSKSPGLE